MRLSTEHSDFRRLVRYPSEFTILAITPHRINYFIMVQTEQSIQESHITKGAIMPNAI